MKDDNNYANQGYYTEYCRQTSRKKNGLFQLIAVAIICSILGGSLVFAGMTFLAPQISPEDNNIEAGAGTNNNSNDNLTNVKYEIETVESPVVAIAEKVKPSVVGIQVTAQVTNFFFGNTQTETAMGSGIIYNSEGYIVTNNHVIDSAVSNRTNTIEDGAKIEVILPSDPDTLYEAKVIGRDSTTDIAILKIDAKNLPAVELGDSDAINVGELAVAIGNPGGTTFMGSVTAGIISGFDRVLGEDNREVKFIQTDAAISSGNSGGPLVNSQGQVIGINSAKLVSDGYSDYEGIGFAIPINLVKGIVDSIMDVGYVKGRAYLGIYYFDQYTAEVAESKNLPAGVYITEAVALEPAQLAGIKSNDVIIEIDGTEITYYDTLIDILAEHDPGDKLKVKVYRYYNLDKPETLEFEVTLGENKG